MSLHHPLLLLTNNMLPYVNILPSCVVIQFIILLRGFDSATLKSTRPYVILWCERCMTVNILALSCIGLKMGAGRGRHREGLSHTTIPPGAEFRGNIAANAVTSRLTGSPLTNLGGAGGAGGAGSGHRGIGASKWTVGPQLGAT